MPNTSMPSLCAAVCVLLLSLFAGCAQMPHRPASHAEIGFMEISSDIKLRTMVLHNPQAKGIVLFLHGFPETIFAWKDVSLALAKDYEVHAFDWPGYGLSSRPPAEIFSYAPRDYAEVLRQYIRKARIDPKKLTI